MTTTWFSLRRRLLILILGGVSICWLTMLIWSYTDTRHEIGELLDNQLVIEARTLLALSTHEAKEMLTPQAAEEADQPQYDELEHLRFQAWSADGRLIMSSLNTPDLKQLTNNGFSDGSDPEGKYPHWRYYSQWSKNGELHVIVGENDYVRDELISHAIRQMLLPAILGLPILGAWVWLAIREGLRPLNVVAEQIAVREPGHLQALNPATAPEEIRPLVESINQLFSRVEKALESEKSFTADAAHELRTPLAALSTQAQVALRARDADERRHAIDQLITSSRRSTRLVDQLLTLARVDPAAAPPSGIVELDWLARQVCAINGPLAVEKGVTLELDTILTTVTGDADMLRIMLRNLVDNAIRYTPAGGHVSVLVTERTLTVIDSGPGIPAADRERVFDRFHRLAGQDKEGSGLGLSIVSRIAERHRAKIQLADAPNGTGLRVSIAFPAT